MGTVDAGIQERAEQLAGSRRNVNDFSIQVATVNGSGSQSANTVLLLSIFQMGVPVSGKNLFPGNMAALPTWYTVRASKNGYVAGKKEIDFLVAMNPETAQEDVMSLVPGAVCVYDEPLNLSSLRKDVTFYPVPYDKLVGPVCPEAKLRRLVKNMIYVGVVDALLGIDLSQSEKSLINQFAVVQAEDELAAIGMVLGAGWAGARSMTSTSGAGISLMGEFVGLGYYAEMPGVIFDIQRVGPSPGLPTRTMQGDILSTAFLSHGDTKHILLLPSSVEECFTMAMEAFELAEKFQTPVFVLSDLDLGMNNWMAHPFAYPETPLDRGKVLSEEDLRKLGGFARYKDVDGDGIPYTTLPGNTHPSAAYFTRGSGHNEKAQYSERGDDYARNMERLARKFETARSFVPSPVRQIDAKSKIGIIAFGTSHWAVAEAHDQLSREYGVKVDYLRVRAYPFNQDVHDFIKSHDRVYVVEQNRDAQMLQLLNLDLRPEQVAKLRSVLHYNGLPIDARSVTDEIIAQEGK